jgi:hypothetical protein
MHRMYPSHDSKERQVKGHIAPIHHILIIAIIIAIITISTGLHAFNELRCAGLDALPHAFWKSQPYKVDHGAPTGLKNVELDFDIPPPEEACHLNQAKHAESIQHRKYDIWGMDCIQN